MTKTGKKPKAIVAVTLYGMPYHVDKILAIAERYGIPVVEDTAESLGSKYRGQNLGTFGKFGVLSFNGNKIITTSGGGALISKPSASTTVFPIFAPASAAARCTCWKPTWPITSTSRNSTKNCSPQSPA